MTEGDGGRKKHGETRNDRQVVVAMAQFPVCWFDCFLVEVKSRSLGVGLYYYGCVYLA